MVLVQLAASSNGCQVVDPQHAEPIALGAQPEPPKAVAGTTRLKDRLGDDHPQPPAPPEVPVGRRVEHEHGEVLFPAAVAALAGAKREQAVALPERAGGLAVVGRQVVPGDPGRVADDEIERL
jgi:hypothetical protein